MQLLCMLEAIVTFTLPERCVLMGVVADLAQAQPLPCDTGDEAGTVYDLWAAHRDSGRTDETQVPA